MECKSCGRANSSGVLYCDHCGAVLGEADEPASCDEGGDQSSRQDVEGVQFQLKISRGGFKGKLFYIEEGDNLIGRWDPDSGSFPEIDLEAVDTEAKVSRKHALIQREGDTIYIEDLGSLNGSYINRGPRLEQGDRQPIKDGDEVIIGKTFLSLKVIND